MDKPIFVLRITLFLLACAAYSATPRTSETPDPPSKNGPPATNLPPIIVQASRLDKTARNIPSAVQVIDHDEIARSGCATVAEALEKLGGLFTRTLNSTPTLAQPAMRGFGDNSFGRILILLNGEQLNNPDMAAPNFLRVPLANINRIEILRGSQCVLHGSYASAGVINIITDDTLHKDETTISASIGAYETYSGAIATTGSFVDEGVSYRATLNWDKSDGYRDNSDYENASAHGAVRKEFGENRFISLSTFYSFSQYGLPGSLSRQEWKTRPRRTNTPHDNSEQENFGLNLGGRTVVGADGYLDAHLLANRRKTFSHWQGASFGSPWSSEYDSDIHAFAFTPQYVLDADIARHRNVLTAGGDLRYETTEFRSAYKDPFFSSLSTWEYDRAQLGGYAQDEFFLLDELSAIFGGRLEWSLHRARSLRSTSFSKREHALEAALLYRPVETVKFFARAGRIYHTPFIDEIFAGAGTPNLKLQAERGYNFEIGAEATLAREWEFSLTLYDMELEREIYYDPAKFQNLNSPGDTRRLGLDSRFGWRRAEVGSLSLYYNAAQSEFTGGPYDHNRVPLVPRHTVGLSGEYYLFHGVAILGGVRHVSNQVLGSDFNNQANRLAPYFLLDCGVRYEPTFASGLALSAGVDNVLDKDYCDYAGWSSGGAYYYPARGRFWRVGASYTF